MTLRRGSGAGLRARDLGQPRAPASTPSGWPWTCATSSTAEVDRRRAGRRGRPARARTRSPRDESHLVVRAMRAGLRRAWASRLPASGCTAATSSRTPAASARRPPPSSAGSALARALVADGAGSLDDAALFRLAADLEGHPDNVAPAVLGGFVISGPTRRRAGTPSARRSTHGSAPSSSCRPTPLSTEVARGLLPARRAARRRRGRRRSHGPARRGAGRPARAPAGRHPRLPAPGATAVRRCRDSLDLVDRLRADGVAGGRVRGRPDRARLRRRRTSRERSRPAMLPTAGAPHGLDRARPAWSGGSSVQRHRRPRC